MTHDEYHQTTAGGYAAALKEDAATDTRRSQEEGNRGSGKASGPQSNEGQLPRVEKTDAGDQYVIITTGGNCGAWQQATGDQYMQRKKEPETCGDHLIAFIDAEWFENL